MTDRTASARTPRRRLLLAALAALCAPTVPAQSPRFTLRIVRPTHAGPATHVYDAAALLALGPEQLRTAVPWDPEPRLWEGVRLQSLLATLGVAGRPLRIKALNDYSAVIPWADLTQFDPLLAWRRDGRAIAVREKGPLLVVYPFSSHSELRRAEYTDRSVWHVNEIVVE